MSLLCRSVLASVDVGNGVTYTVSYKDENNTWHDITSSGGATVGYISREYQVRFRFLMPSNMAINQPYDINLTLNHQQSVIERIGVTVLDTSGATLNSSDCSWTSITQQHNSSYTKDNIGIYGFRCNIATWVTLSFSYYSTSAPNPGGGTTGIISCGVTQFSIAETSNDSLIIDFNNSVHNDFQDLIEQESINNNNIINNNNNNHNELMSQMSEQESRQLEIESFKQEFASASHEEQVSMWQDILDEQRSHTVQFAGIAETLEAIWDFFVDFFTNLQNFFVPDADDLADFLEEQVQDLQDDAPLLSDMLEFFSGVFETIGSGQQVDHFTIPGFTIPLPENNSWRFNAIDVPLFPSGMNYLLYAVRSFNAIVISLAVARMIYGRVFDLFGIARKDNLIDIEDD